MHAVSTFVLVMGWLVAASATFAQTIVAPPTAAQRCLTRGEVTLGTPAYPQESFARRDSGRVVVELDFDRPNAAPHVKFGKTEGGAAFEDAVRDFVAAYRVPCLEPGQKTQLRQEFVFKPTDGRRVNASEPIDADELRRVRLQACVSQLRPDVRITYPPAARERAEYGTVVLRLEFTDSKSAPRVTVLDNVRSSSLAFAAMAHAEGYRMPCHEGAAVDFVQFYVFKFDGDRSVVLSDVSFVTFLRRVKGIQNAKVYFDFKTMGCPFEVRLTLYQPHSANRVGELGEPNPERRFFFDWLRRQELNLDRKTLNAVLSQDMTITVPCTVLQLGEHTGGGAGQ